MTVVAASVTAVLILGASVIAFSLFHDEAGASNRSGIEFALSLSTTVGICLLFGATIATFWA